MATFSALTLDDEQRFKQQVSEGNFTDVCRYLDETRKAEDWQERAYLLNLVAPQIPRDAVVAACQNEQDSLSLRLLYIASTAFCARSSRGAARADQTSAEQFQAAHDYLEQMMLAVDAAIEDDPHDPIPRLYAIRELSMFSRYADRMIHEYNAILQIAPDFTPAHFSMVSGRAKKWGGSHDESLLLARSAMVHFSHGSDLPSCLFLAHFLVWQYAARFEKNTKKAIRYRKSAAVRKELNQALDQWLSEDYRPKRSSLYFLHEAALWYYLNKDYFRLQRVMDAIGDDSYSSAQQFQSMWAQIGDPEKRYADAQRKAKRPHWYTFLSWLR